MDLHWPAVARCECEESEAGRSRHRSRPALAMVFEWLLLLCSCRTGKCTSLRAAAQPHLAPNAQQAVAEFVFEWSLLQLLVRPSNHQHPMDSEQQRNHA